MNEITRIHLAKTPYDIEINAKKSLEQYLAAIEKTLQADEDAMREIEARIVELLIERGVVEKVVTNSDVEAIISQLGAPAEFIDDTDTSKEVAEALVGQKKRLMRDEEHGKIGGVFAGIAAYTGVDTVWIRLAAIIVFLFSVGTVTLVYVVLWIVMPPARTAAEKLQMAGKPVTLAAIKEESARAITDHRDPSKRPLVILLRGVLGLGWLFAGLAALGVTCAVWFAALTQSAWGTVTTEFGDLSGVLGAAFALYTLSGILLMVLFWLLSHASFAWKITKKTVVATIVTVLLGLVSFTIGSAMVWYAQATQQQRAEQYEHTEKVDLGDRLRSVKTLSAGFEQVPVYYVVTDQSPRLEVKSTARYANDRPVAALDVSGDRATVSLTNQDKVRCSMSHEWNCVDGASVTIYGPALETIDAHRDSRVIYSSEKQQAITVSAQESASVTLEGDIIETKASLQKQAQLWADDANLRQVDVTVQELSSATFGNVKVAKVTAPESCGSDRRADIAFDTVGVLKNSQDVTLDQDDDMTYLCADIAIREER